jgi:3D (Asp-Asp-Asp) domain-containing protein
MANQPIILARLRGILGRYRFETAVAMLAILLVGQMASTTAAKAGEAQRANERVVALQVAAMQNETAPHGRLPHARRRWTIRIPITAYSSEVGQTDSTPFITASGSRVRDGIVAANFLPIGTRVRIPEIYGKKEFVVEDRMNARYHHKMDIWMEQTPDARQFGLKYAEIEVLPN